MANAPRQPSVETLREEVAALERTVARLRTDLERPPPFRRRPSVMTVTTILLIVLLVIEVVVAFSMGYRAGKDFNPNMPNCRNETADGPHLRV